MTNTTLTTALRAADIRPFESMWMASEKDLAQLALSGRTHYADSDTLRFFNARINETRQSDDGLWFALRDGIDWEERTLAGLEWRAQRQAEEAAQTLEALGA